MAPAAYADKANRNLANGNIKVCMLCDLYPPLFSGASIQAHRLSKILLERGTKVFVLAGRYPGTKVEEEIEGVSVRRVGLVNSDAVMIRPFSMAFSLLPVLFAYRRAFDILHIHSVKLFDFIPIFFARLLKKKVIVKMTLLGSITDPGVWLTSRLGILMRWSFAQADRIVSISVPLSENYRRCGLDPSKLRHLPQGVDIHRFSPVTDAQKLDVRSALSLQGRAKYLCFVGSFKHRKGADILVNAFICMAQQYPDLNLLVIGPDTFDDPVRAKRHYEVFAEDLKCRIATSGLAERVVFTGRTDDVPSYLQASDIFIFPSRREGLPSAVLEAMSVGLPCVLASLDGIASEITANGEAAVIIDTESPADYEKAISHLLSDPEAAAQLGKRARRRVEEVYSMKIVADRYLELYRELLGPQETIIQ